MPLRTFSLIFFLSCSGLVAQPFGLSVTIGLNSPLVDDGDLTGNTLYTDEDGNSQMGEREVKGMLLTPPLRLTGLYQINQKLFIGPNLIFQAHSEREIIRSAQGVFVSESRATHTALMVFADVSFMWLDTEKISLLSGAGLGYGWSSIQSTANLGAQAVCFDIRPITVHYKLCCGWSLFVDTRYTSSPTGFDRIAGYSIGLGVSHLF